MNLKQPPLVVITGASAGIGAAIAQRFAKGNFRLVLLARRLDRLEELKKQIKVPMYPMELDVSDREAVVKTIAQIEKDHGPIEVLVNSAGLAIGMEPAYQSDLNEWDQCIDVNLTSSPP